MCSCLVQVVLCFGNKSSMCGQLMLDTDFSEHLSSSVIHTMFTRHKLKNKSGGLLNIAQKHPSLAESIVWNFTNPAKTDKVTMWDVFGGTGALSFGALDQGVSIIYTEQDPAQFSFVKSKLAMYEKRRAIDVLAVSRVPRQLLVPHVDFRIDDATALWDKHTNIGRELDTFKHNPDALIPVRGNVTSLSKMGVMTVCCLCNTFSLP